jgi:hypothetical protein
MLTPRCNAAIASVLAFGVMLFFYLYWFHGNITGFFHIGTILPFSPYVDQATAFTYPGQVGYDGQMFLSMALDPFLQNPGTIAALDNPLYRYKRILYPLLGYVLGLGNREIIPYALVAINYLCIVALVGMASRMNPIRRWQGLLVLAIPGVWMTLAFSTADLLSSTLLMAAIFYYRDRRSTFRRSTFRRSTLMSLAIAAACLTRETMVLGWLALMIASITDRHWAQVKHLAVAIVPAIAWNFHVAQKLAHQGDSGIAASFGGPGMGILHKISTVIQAGLTGNNLFEIYLFGLLLVTLGMTIAIARPNPAKNRVIWLCACLYGVTLLFSGDQILGYFLGYSRVYIDVFLLLVLVGDRAHQRLKSIILLAGILPSLAFILLAR